MMWVRVLPPSPAADKVHHGTVSASAVEHISGNQRIWFATIGSDDERRKTLAGDVTVGWVGMPTKNKGIL